MARLVKSLPCYMPEAWERYGYRSSVIRIWTWETFAETRSQNWSKWPRIILPRRVNAEEDWELILRRLLLKMNAGYFYGQISAIELWWDMHRSDNHKVAGFDAAWVEQNIYLIVSSLVSDVCNFDFFVMRWKSEKRLDIIYSLCGYC